jgi:hypothetical protein
MSYFIALVFLVLAVLALLEGKTLGGTGLFVISAALFLYARVWKK